MSSEAYCARCRVHSGVLNTPLGRQRGTRGRASKSSRVYSRHCCVHTSFFKTWSCPDECFQINVVSARVCPTRYRVYSVLNKPPGQRRRTRGRASQLRITKKTVSSTLSRHHERIYIYIYRYVYIYIYIYIYITVCVCVCLMCVCF